jgi:hypothetical protein
MSADYPARLGNQPILKSAFCPWAGVRFHGSRQKKIRSSTVSAESAFRAELGNLPYRAVYPRLYNSERKVVHVFRFAQAFHREPFHLFAGNANWRQQNAASALRWKSIRN